MPINLERVLERELARRTKRHSFDAWANLLWLRRNFQLRLSSWLRYNRRLVQLALWCWMWHFDRAAPGRLSRRTIVDCYSPR